MRTNRFVVGGPFVCDQEQRNVEGVGMGCSTSTACTLCTVNRVYGQPRFGGRTRRVTFKLGRCFAIGSYFLCNRKPGVTSRAPGNYHPMSLLCGMRRSLPGVTCCTIVTGSVRLFSLIRHSVSARLRFVLPSNT